MASSREENYTFEDLMKSAGNEPYLDSGLEDLNDEEKMNNLLRELIEGSGDPSDHQPRDIFKPPPGYDVDGRRIAGAGADGVPEIRDIFKPPPGYDVEGRRISVGSGGSTTSGGGSDNYYGVPGKTSSLDDALKRLDALKEIIANPKPNDYRKYEKDLSEAFESIIPPSPGKTSSLDDALKRLDALKEFIANPKTYDYNRMKELFTKTKVGGMLQDSSNRGGSTTSGGGSDGGYGVPGQLDHPIFQQSFSGGAKQMVDWFGRWLEKNPPPEERPHDLALKQLGKVLDFGEGMFQGFDLGKFGSTVYQNLIKEFGKKLPGVPAPSGVGGGSTTSGGGVEPSVYGVGAPLGFPGQLDHRIFQPPSDSLQPNHPSLQRSPPSTTSATYRRAIDPPSIYREEGMLTPAPGRDVNSRMDSGLEDYLNEPPSQAYPTMDKLGDGFYAPTKQTEKEPELFGTFLKSLLGKGMFQDVEFKPWALDKFEDRMNEAPLVERWAAQMKEQIGWQYMTPAERKDYIKKNKNNKNNHIIMDYNMYRRR